MSKNLVAAVAVICVSLLILTISGCGCNDKENGEDGTEKRPESVTGFEAVQYCKSEAEKWQEENWMVQLRSGAPVGRDGKAEIWTVYFFSPKEEIGGTQISIMYNRGNVWPNVPGKCKGGEEGLKVYKENRPPDFRVDSPQAYTVASRNGGAEYTDGHPDAQPNATLRCKADYDAVGEEMPAPKYQWIWDVYYRELRAGAEVLHIMVDGMTGDFITKELKQPPS